MTSVAPRPPSSTTDPRAARDGAVVRVLFLYDHLGYPGGATHGLTRYCLNVLPRLDRPPIALTACFLREPHPAAAGLAERGVEPYFLNRPKWDPRALADVLRLIRRHRIDVVHAVGQKGILAGCTAARIAGCGVVIHLRDVYPLGPVIRPLMRRVARGTDLALGVSAAVCRHATREYAIAPERVQLLYNGIVLDDFTPQDDGARGAAWRARVGVPQRARVIAIVGRLAAVKGHGRLLRQLPRILERVPEAVLAVVGGGPLRADLEAEAERLGVQRAVRFTGQQDDIAAVLEAADVLAIPSDHEGLSNVALEALAMGTPVVATRVGGLPEVLGDGRFGTLVDLDDRDALGDALVRVLDAPRPRRAGRDAALREHLARFSIERHVERQREVYLEVARRARRRPA